MANIAILGFGNIGSGTLEVLRASAQGVAAVRESRSR